MCLILKVSRHKFPPHFAAWAMGLQFTNPFPVMSPTSAYLTNMKPANAKICLNCVSASGV